MSAFSASDRSRMRWRSRRGLLELDLILTRFLATEFDQLDDAQLGTYVQLLDLPDNDFLDLVNGKATLADPALQALVEQLRQV